MPNATTCAACGGIGSVGQSEKLCPTCGGTGYDLMLLHPEVHEHEGLEGPPGPQGEQGIQGLQGLQGEPGSDASVTKENVEAVLTGEINSHTHAGGGGPAFPIGSVFLAVVDTDPATLLGYGTWSAIAAGKVLIGLDSGDVDFDVAEETGGVKTHTHTGHDAHVFTQPSDHAALSHAGSAVDDHAAHTHVAGTLAADTATGSRKGGTSGAATLTDSHAHTISGATGDPSATLTHSVTQPSDHAAMSHAGGAVDAHSAHDSPSHVPPYFVVYIWKRTA